MNGFHLLLKNDMMKRILYLSSALFLFSCLEDLPFEADSQQYISNGDISWFYNIDNQELFVQIDVNYIGLNNVNHVYIKDLNNPNCEYYEIFDDGDNGDLNPGETIDIQIPLKNYDQSGQNGGEK